MLKRSFGVLAVAVAAISCGGGNSPTSPSQQVAQVAGVWAVTGTFTSVTGGECLASTFQSLVGRTGTGTMQVTHSGSTLSATATDDASGASCSYQGSAGASSVALNLTSCIASDAIGAACPNGARRDVRLQTGAVTASVAENTATGTSA